MIESRPCHSPTRHAHPTVNHARPHSSKTPQANALSESAFGERRTAIKSNHRKRIALAVHTYIQTCAPRAKHGPLTYNTRATTPTRRPKAPMLLRPNCAQFEGDAPSSAIFLHSYLASAATDPLRCQSYLLVHFFDREGTVVHSEVINNQLLR